MTRRVLVTRPAREAMRWVEALCALDFDARALPLLVIDALNDDSALLAARARVDQYHALMFVSAAAVEHFFDEGRAPGSSPRCWATGPGTAAALRAAGVPDARIDVPGDDASQFDSEALWQLVQPQLRASKTRVLIVRGGDGEGRPAGRDWLARELAAAGVNHDAVVAYRRMRPVWSEPERRLALDAAGDGSVWLFSSAQAIANLLRELPQTRWSAARAIGTHPRIAQAARDSGFGQVVHAKAEPGALAASIESFG